MNLPTATLATKKRACLLGAEFIENDLREMRARLQRSFRMYEDQGRNPDEHPPVTTSHEGDMLKTMEWASAVTWLRAMAEAEDA